MRFLGAIFFLFATTVAFADGPIPFEYQVDETYVGNGSVERNDRHRTDLDENDFSAQLVFTPRIKLGILRLGAEYERYDFGLDRSEPLPQRLQSLHAIIGLDTQFSDSILVRVEAQPGIYGETLAGRNFNLPVVAGGTYIYSEDVQLVLGVMVDGNLRYPVIPGGGIRWKFQPQWTLNAVLPTPRLEYEVTKNFTGYVGANFKETSFRVNDDRGLTRGARRLDDATLDYTEIRTGAGVDWKLTSWLSFNAEAGYQPYRTFDFFRANIRYHQDEGAPYGMIALHGAF